MAFLWHEPGPAPAVAVILLWGNRVGGVWFVWAAAELPRSWEPVPGSRAVYMDSARSLWNQSSRRKEDQNRNKLLK